MYVIFSHSCEQRYLLFRNRSGENGRAVTLFPLPSSSANSDLLLSQLTLN